METIVETHQGTIKVVKYNKPNKKNALDVKMYLRVIEILEKAANDDSVSVMVLTGTGDFYSSGNDIIAAMEYSKDHNVLSIIKEYINAFIKFPKILVAIVNGPAIGIAATTLALCDLVFASENAYFYTPFAKLGLVAEGCSSVTFPRLIGERKAAEMLIFNHMMSSKEALDWGFVNYLYKPEQIQSQVWDKIIKVSKLHKHSTHASKKLLRSSIQDKLLQANELEIDELNKIIKSEEYVKTIMSFMNKKSKI